MLGARRGARGIARYSYITGTGTLTNNSTGTITLKNQSTLNIQVALAQKGRVDLDTGSLSISGDLKLKATATLAVTMGAAAHGSLTVTGDTQLAGKLAITTQAGYTPPAGTAATIVTTTGNQTGGFATITGQAITGTTRWDMSTAANHVTLTVVPVVGAASIVRRPR